MSSVKFGSVEGGISVFAGNAELIRAGSVGVPVSWGAGSTTGLGGGAAAEEAQECTPVLPLAQGAAHLGGAAKPCQAAARDRNLDSWLCIFY